MVAAAAAAAVVAKCFQHGKHILIKKRMMKKITIYESGYISHRVWYVAVHCPG